MKDFLTQTSLAWHTYAFPIIVATGLTATTYALCHAHRKPCVFFFFLLKATLGLRNQ